MHSIVNQNFIIKLMFIILVVLTLRLMINVDTDVHIQSYESYEAYVAVSGSSSPSYVNEYPDLYASSKNIPSKLPSGGKTVYLTFDDGPSTHTDEVLDILDKYNIKATFFIMGCGVGEAGRERLTRIVESGHTIGIHTFSHDYEDIYSSVNAYLADFDKVYRLVCDATGIKPNIFRFPGGSNNRYIGNRKKRIITEMTRRGFTYYDWTVSAEDSVGKPTVSSINKYLAMTFNHSYPVVLMHDSASNRLTVSILPEFIDKLIANGYQFDTLNNRAPVQYR